jgi:hypothetical protein
MEGVRLEPGTSVGAQSVIVPPPHLSVDVRWWAQAAW